MLVILVRMTFVPFFLLWQDFERVLWWWGGQCPLQRIRIFVPVVVLGDALSACQRVEHDTDEEQERGEGQERTVRADLVPVGEGLGIVDVTAWHALTSQEVLWEEG